MTHRTCLCLWGHQNGYLEMGFFFFFPKTQRDTGSKHSCCSKKRWFQNQRVPVALEGRWVQLLSWLVDSGQMTGGKSLPIRHCPGRHCWSETLRGG